MQAIILAGGFGTRLQSVVSDVPKPMAPVAGEPFLTYILEELYLQGFTKVILAVGYKKEIIMQYYGNSYKEMSLVYSVEDEPLGTGGCIQKALSMAEDDYVFVLNGDTMFRIDFNQMAKQNALTIACKKMIDFQRYGEVKLKNHQIISFAEKQYVHEGYINGGIYLLPKNLFHDYPLPKKFSMEKDFFEQYIHRLHIHAFLSDAYFIDIGIPEDYSRAQEDFKKKKAVFLDRDGIINTDYGHVHTVEAFEFTDFIFPLCRRYQSEGYLLIVITNQAGIGKGLYTENEFEILNTYMLKEFEKQGISIAKVYHCPHSPEEHCLCRKPKPGLFLQAIRELNLDASRCIAIGDKMTDLEAAQAAGIPNLYFKKTRYEEYPVSFAYKTLE